MGHGDNQHRIARLATVNSSVFAEHFTGRDVQLVSAASLQELPAALASQAGPFLLFVAAGTTTLSDRAVVAICEELLRQGAVYAICWGPNSTHLKALFEQAASFLHGDGPRTVKMTSHEHESLQDALWFAVHTAYPHDAHEEGWTRLVVATVASEDWRRRAEAFLLAGAPEPALT